MLAWYDVPADADHASRPGYKTEGFSPPKRFADRNKGKTKGS
jgi:hypothetical protein